MTWAACIEMRRTTVSEGEAKARARTGGDKDH